MSDTGLPSPIWLIGCGNMAGAMLSRWVETGVNPASFLVIRPSGAAVAPGVQVVTTVPEGGPPRIALLGVKPQKLDEVAPALAARLGPNTLLLSILAGVELQSLRCRFPQVRDIVRVMPNTPVRVGLGAIGLYANDLREEPRRVVEQLIQPLGAFEWIDDESLFDVVSALTASGPAFVFRFIDALASGAVTLGLPEDQAARLALHMVGGAAALADHGTETPRQLADRVASPGGMTREGLDILDSEKALDRLVAETLAAAVRRSRDMGRAAAGEKGP